MEIQIKKNQINSITGHQCNKGLDYSKEELFAPKRTLTTTVKVNNGTLPLVSVRTDKPVPKELVFPIMAELRKLTLQAPVKIGDVILEHVKDTDADVVATKTVEKKGKRVDHSKSI
jgi:CxxC motif-containing protein